MTRRGEIPIPYDPLQERLYKAGDSGCAFHGVRWPLSAGRGRFGEFPVVVARVLPGPRLRSPRLRANLPRRGGFILVSYPGKRRAGDPAYRRMARIFGSTVLAALNARADDAKRKRTRSAGGGDPDLFVYRRDNPGDRFFVEVKHRDRQTKKQKVTFPLIRQLCPVLIARLHATGSVVQPPNKRMKLSARARPSG